MAIFSLIFMSIKVSILNFLGITKKKLIVAILFPLTAVLILISFFIFDEILGIGSNVIINTIYSFEEYLYNFIFLPLTFIDIDFTPSIIFKMALILTVIWWYFLSCALIFLLGKKWRK